MCEVSQMYKILLFPTKIEDAADMSFRPLIDMKLYEHYQLAELSRYTGSCEIILSIFFWTIQHPNYAS